MIFKDYYKILGLDTNRVTDSEIKIAFRDQAKKYHPDVNTQNNEERFKDINEAYRILSNPITKRKYDRIWNRNVGKYKSKVGYERSNGKNPINDMFQMFFGDSLGTVKKEEPAAYKGENVETEIKLSIEDAFRGIEKSIKLRTVDGSMKILKVQIPAGIQNNEKIRLVGQGKPGRNGGRNGDLFVRVKIKDNDRFKLVGYDLKSDLNLTPWEAALSTKIVFNGINEDINVFVPNGTCSGEQIVIPNRGYKDGKGGRGNLILEAKIMIPKHISEDDRHLYQELAHKSNDNPRVN